MRVVIVDDEALRSPRNRNAPRHVADVEIVGEAQDAKSEWRHPRACT
jgi:DNA-binding NarL/FixJ family response regulator